MPTILHFGILTEGAFAGWFDPIPKVASIVMDTIIEKPKIKILNIEEISAEPESADTVKMLASLVEDYL